MACNKLECSVCLSALVTAIVVFIVCYYCFSLHHLIKYREQRSPFAPASLSGVTCGAMPSIDAPPPRSCGAAGTAARGQATCCDGFNVPPPV